MVEVSRRMAEGRHPRRWEVGRELEVLIRGERDEKVVSWR